MSLSSTLRKDRILHFLDEHRGNEFGGNEIRKRACVSLSGIYVSLASLEEDGLISGRYEKIRIQENGEDVDLDRRFYKITDHGSRYRRNQPDKSSLISGFLSDSDPIPA